MKLIADTVDALIEKELKTGGSVDRPSVDQGPTVAAVGTGGRAVLATLEGGVAVTDGNGYAEIGRYGVAYASGIGGTARGGAVCIAGVWHGGSAVCGDGGVAVTHFGTSTVGKTGVAIADRGRVLGGHGSILILAYKDPDGETGYVVEHVGKNGIEPDTAYKLNADHKFVPVREDDEIIHGEL